MGQEITVYPNLIAAGNDCGLAIADDQVGDSLSIALDEEPDSPIEWVLLVDVQTDEGRYRLGRIITTPPVGGANPPSRIVGFAGCPGAKHWYVLAVPGNGNAFVAWQGRKAFLALATSRQGIVNFGVVTNNPGPAF